MCGVNTAPARRSSARLRKPWLRLTLRAADVRLFDMVRRDAAVQKQKLWELVQMLDIWNLRSFQGQSRRERAWNAATRVLPALTWLAKYNVRKQLLNDIAAGIAVSFLIVPQARRAGPLAIERRSDAHAAARRGCLMLAWRGSPPSKAFVRARCRARAMELRLTLLRASADADFVPLFFYFCFGSSMYLQIGAVAIVSLLTRSTIECAPAGPACRELALTRASRLPATSSLRTRRPWRCSRLRQPRR